MLPLQSQRLSIPLSFDYLIEYAEKGVTEIIYIKNGIRLKTATYCAIISFEEYKRRVTKYLTKAILVFTSKYVTIRACIIVIIIIAVIIGHHLPPLH